MKISPLSLIAVMIVVIAIALAGCTSSTPSAPSTSGAAPAGAAPAAAPAAGSSSGGAVSGSDMFGGLNYNWVEYKMSTGSGSDAMTIYMKWDKTNGKCTMRFEGAGAAGMQGVPTTMDCGSTGGKAQSNPNQVSSDAKVDCGAIPESVTVPAGTFSATKCTITSQGQTSTAWIDKGKFMVKMQSSSTQGAIDMVLNAYG